MDKRSAEGAATPETATDEVQADSSNNFNKFISLENDRLRIEIEQHVKDKQAMEASFAMQFDAVAATYRNIANANYRNSTWAREIGGSLREQLDNLNVGDDREDLETLIERLNFIVFCICEAHEQTAENIERLADESSFRNLSDGAKEIVEGYTELANKYEDLRQQVARQQAFPLLDDEKVQHLFETQGVRI